MDHNNFVLADSASLSFASLQQINFSVNPDFYRLKNGTLRIGSFKSGPALPDHCRLRSYRDRVELRQTSRTIKQLIVSRKHFGFVPCNSYKFFPGACVKSAGTNCVPINPGPIRIVLGCEKAMHCPSGYYRARRKQSAPGTVRIPGS